MNGLRLYDRKLVPQFRMELSRQEVNRIIKRLPLSDSLAALDYMARNLWDGPEYDINEWGYWAKV
jgi:hypothetical protein